MASDGGYSQDGGYGCGSSYANHGQHYVRDHYSRDEVWIVTAHAVTAGAATAVTMDALE